jgi:hypothetical protein
MYYYYGGRGVSRALTWDHRREKASDPYTAAPRTFIYAIEVAEFMEIIKTGRQHTLPADYEQTGCETARVCAARASHTDLGLYTSTPCPAKEFSFHPYILEDGPELPTSN